MPSSLTSQQLVVVHQQHACLNALEQKLLIYTKRHYSLTDSSKQLEKLVNMSMYHECTMIEEQLLLIKVATVKKRRKHIKNFAHKLDLFNYFIRTCTSRFDTDEQ